MTKILKKSFFWSKGKGDSILSLYFLLSLEKAETKIGLEEKKCHNLRPHGACQETNFLNNNC